MSWDNKLHFLSVTKVSHVAAPLPSHCSPILCWHAAAKIVKLQDHSNAAGGCRWWSTESCTVQGSQSKISVAMIWSPSLPNSIGSLVSPHGKAVWKEAVETVLVYRRLFASMTIIIIRSVRRHQSQIMPIYLAVYHKVNHCMDLSSMEL